MSEKFEDMKEIKSEEIHDAKFMPLKGEIVFCVKKSFLTSESVRVFGWFHADELVEVCK